MAACKCRQCKSKLTTAIAYKATVDGKAAYFCDDRCYSQYAQQIEQKAKDKLLQDKYYRLMCNILGVNGITNTAVWKEKSEINKVFSDEVIVSFLEENQDWMTKSVGRLNGGEFGKIRYVCAILRNKLGDYKPKAIDQKQTYPTDEHYETKFKLKTRKALLELEVECYE